MPPKPSTTTPSIPAPTRRTSLAPPKLTAPSAKSGTLSASTSGKLSSATTSSAVKSSVPQRTSLVSPDSTASAKSATTSRPRVPVSEGATQKRAAAPRASLAPSAKQPATSTARPARSSGAGSISSFKDVKEVKERGTDVVEIQSKVQHRPHIPGGCSTLTSLQLAEATASLDLKTSAISLLETEVEKLKASLDSITADLEAVQGNLGNAELAKAAADKELADTKAALVASQGDGGKLEQVSEELEAARTASAKQDAIIETLQEQVKALQTEVDESRRALEALRADQANNNSDLIATAEMDRQALLKARADLEAIKTETSALKVAQAEALDAATAKINTLQDQASRAEALAAEIDSLHAGKEETSTKLSELEIEILELKEHESKRRKSAERGRLRLTPYTEEWQQMERPRTRLFRKRQQRKVPSHCTWRRSRSSTKRPWHSS
ncbi:hypothetical protein BC826DRAFT_27035 [Russula brevipes]|nr:hypothetical protein BC826DRAFT_27035 [Russula brevipes]